MAIANDVKHPSSYRDPAGFIFKEGNTFYRQINNVYKNNYDLLLSSGLYDELVKNKHLIPHEEIENQSLDENSYKWIKPLQLPFISYPYEWSFDMLKDAAIATLDITTTAIKHGMILKDATAFNLQLVNGKMTFIDTLSFEKYDDTQPWVAYKQFCEHFLAPLALMTYNKLPLQQLMFSYPEGIPLNVASNLLPWKTKMNLHIYLHIHLNGKIQSKQTLYKSAKNKPFSQSKLLNILKSLRETIQSFKLEHKTTWANYYAEAEQRGNYLENKHRIISAWLSKSDNINNVIDVGANDGSFSMLASEKGIYTVAADSDHYAINKLYNEIKKRDLETLHPLIIDFTNPSAAIGFNNNERESFLNRKQFDLVFSFAFIHHLCIGKNIPFHFIAEMFRKLGENLIIEFVPKYDSKIEEMLKNKKDIYDWYTEENFINAFNKFYKIVDKKDVSNSGRSLYFMTTHENAIS